MENRKALGTSCLEAAVPVITPPRPNEQRVHSYSLIRCAEIQITRVQSVTITRDPLSNKGK